MKLQNKKAFTLIEFVIVITIAGMLMVWVHAPYNVYQTKQKVRNSVKILTQTLYEARNLAINWLNERSTAADTGVDSSNKKIGVHLKWGNGVINIYGYSIGDVIDLDPSKLLKSEALAPWVEIEKIWGSHSEALFVYNPITWDLTHRYWSSWLFVPFASTVDTVEIDIRYKNASVTDFFKRTVTYYPKTFISDY